MIYRFSKRMKKYIHSGWCHFFLVYADHFTYGFHGVPSVTVYICIYTYTRIL